MVTRNRSEVILFTKTNLAVQKQNYGEWLNEPGNKVCVRGGGGGGGK
jgi:hypothetical protein